MSVFRESVALFKKEFAVWRLVAAHPRTPWLAKALLALAVAYAISPIDLIPDFIPVLGHLDDLVIIPCLIFLAVRLVPKEVVEECRRQVK